MEKYAVTYEDEPTKTAAKGDKKACPDCKGPVEQDRQLLMWCPNCGTYPFEKRPADAKKG